MRHRIDRHSAGIKGTSIVGLTAAVLLLCLPAFGRETTASFESPDRTLAEQRRDIHAELPADANVRESLHTQTEPEANAVDEDLDTPCPCRSIVVEEDPRRDPLPDLIKRSGLIFGSAVLAVLAALAGWQVYGSRR